jgi:hypothetical protein
VPGIDASAITRCEKSPVLAEGGRHDEFLGTIRDGLGRADEWISRHDAG